MHTVRVGNENSVMEVEPEQPTTAGAEIETMVITT